MIAVVAVLGILALASAVVGACVALLTAGWVAHRRRKRKLELWAKARGSWPVPGSWEPFWRADRNLWADADE